MAHLLTKHHLPHVNIALVIAAVWLALAAAASVYDVGHLLLAW